MNKIELLAPAGSYEGFMAALQAGADAIYVGGQSFGARAYAKNFTEEELIRAIHTAHLYGKKVYLTINTLMKNRELEEKFYTYFQPYYEAGIDAVIVQDLGTAEYLKKYFPLVPLHASTQMTVTGAAGMKFLEEKGFQRVVTARELSLEEISEMHKKSTIEIEAFIHGALCYSFSGQCLMSSLLGGRSGNRGRCAQPCRLNYQVLDERKRELLGKDHCPLSLRDICTLDILPEIIEAGVTSLKIEGRMKKPEYTAGVVQIYRKYLDKLIKNPKEWKVDPKDREALLQIFSRGGSCEGYFKQHNGPDMMDFHNDKKTSGNTVVIKEKKIGLAGELTLIPDCPAILNVKYGDLELAVTHGMVQSPQKQPLSRERIEKQMMKCGTSVFQWENLDIWADMPVFISISELNELRRKAFSALEDSICSSYRRKAVEREENTGKKKAPFFQKKALNLYASCEEWEQFLVIKDVSEITGIYAPYKIVRKALDEKLLNGKELYLSFPAIVRNPIPKLWLEQIESDLTSGLTGFLVPNLEAYAALKEKHLESYCVIDHSLYTWNDRAVNFWENEKILRNTVPLELNEKELLYRKNDTSEMLLYGRLPLMVTAQCLKKNTSVCSGRSEKVFLKDRMQAVFPVQCVCDPWQIGKASKNICYNRIYNSVPLELFTEMAKIQALGMQSYRLSFTLESQEETRQIIEEFMNVYQNEKDTSKKNITKGHFKRGVE